MGFSGGGGGGSPLPMSRYLRWVAPAIPFNWVVPSGVLIARIRTTAGGGGGASGGSSNVAATLQAGGSGGAGGGIAEIITPMIPGDTWTVQDGSMAGGTGGIASLAGGHAGHAGGLGGGFEFYSVATNFGLVCNGGQGGGVAAASSAVVAGAPLYGLGAMSQILSDYVTNPMALTPGSGGYFQGVGDQPPDPYLHAAGGAAGGPASGTLIGGGAGQAIIQIPGFPNTFEYGEISTLANVSGTFTGDPGVTAQAPGCGGGGGGGGDVGGKGGAGGAGGPGMIEIWY